MIKEDGFVDDYLAYLLARASHLMSSEFHAVVESNGLSLLEWRVLASLWGKDFLSIGELSDLVLAKQPTLTKLIGRMSQTGWVTRVDSARDKRLSLVSLTEQGRLKAGPLIAQARTHEAGIVSGMQSAEWSALKIQLTRIIESHKAKRPTER